MTNPWEGRMTNDQRTEAAELIAAYNRTEATQAARRSAIFDAVANLTGHRRLILPSI